LLTQHLEALVADLVLPQKLVKGRKRREEKEYVDDVRRELD
jgi:hypothetical protein